MNTNKRPTFKSIKAQFMGQVIVDVTGREGRVFKVESHDTAGGFMHARDNEGKTFVSFPQHIKAIKVERVEILGYTLTLDELLAAS